MSELLARLEHIGDSVLGMFVTKLLYDLYPDLTEGGASVSNIYENHWYRPHDCSMQTIRSMMVSNNNLAGMYAFCFLFLFV